MSERPYQKKGQFFHFLALIQGRFLVFLLMLYFKMLIVNVLFKIFSSNKMIVFGKNFCKVRGF
jgi:hypothetical protein